MKEPSAGGDAAAITIVTIGRLEAIFLVLCGGVLAAVWPFNEHQDGPPWFKRMPLTVPLVVAYLAVVALVSAWVLYRGCKLGARFDDQGVTVRRLMRTDRYSWPEVSHFADGHSRDGGGVSWALDIVLSDGRAVTVKPISRSKAQAAIERVAERYSVSAELTGTARTRDGQPAKPGLHPDPGGKPGMRHWDGSEWSPLLQPSPASDGAEANKPASGGPEVGKPAEVWSPLAGSKQQWQDAAAKARNAEILLAVALPVTVITLAGSWVLFLWYNSHDNNFSLSTLAFIVGLFESVFALAAWNSRKEQRKIDKAGRATAGLADTASPAPAPVRQRYLLICLCVCLNVCVTALFIIGVIGFNSAPANSGLSHTMAWIIGLSLAGELLSLILLFQTVPHAPGPV